MVSRQAPAAAGEHAPPQHTTWRRTVQACRLLAHSPSQHRLPGLGQLHGRERCRRASQGRLACAQDTLKQVRLCSHLGPTCISLEPRRDMCFLDAINTRHTEDSGAAEARKGGRADLAVWSWGFRHRQLKAIHSTFWDYIYQASKPRLELCLQNQGDRCSPAQLVFSAAAEPECLAGS